LGRLKNGRAFCLVLSRKVVPLRRDSRRDNRRNRSKLPRGSLIKDRNRNKDRLRMIRLNKLMADLQRSNLNLARLI